MPSSASAGTATWTSGTGLTISDLSSGVSQLATSFSNGAATVNFGTAKTGASGALTVNFKANDGSTATSTLTLVSGETIGGFVTDLGSLTSGATVAWTSGTGLTITDNSSGVSQLATSFTQGSTTVNFGTAKTGTSGALTVNFTTHNGTAATSTMTLVSGETIADFTAPSIASPVSAQRLHGPPGQE